MHFRILYSRVKGNISSAELSGISVEADLFSAYKEKIYVGNHEK